MTAVDEEEGHPEEQIDSHVFTFNPNHLVERGHQERHHQMPEERPRHQQAEQGSRVPQGGQMQGGVFQRCEQGGRAGEQPNLVRSFDRPQHDCNPGYPRRVGDEPEERRQYQNENERPGQLPRFQGRVLAGYEVEEGYQQGQRVQYVSAPKIGQLKGVPIWDCKSGLIPFIAYQQQLVEFRLTNSAAWDEGEG